MQDPPGPPAISPTRYCFKVVLAGPWGVGKTSLARKFVEKKFGQDYLPTIGASVMITQVLVHVRGEEVLVTLSIWDIAAQDTFKVMRGVFYNATRGAFLVADLSRAPSFEEVQEWAEELRAQLPAIPVVFLANKSDLEHGIGEQFIQEVAKKVGALKSFKTSALNGDNVQEAFTYLAEKMLQE